MKLRITPPAGFTPDECTFHLRHVVRTRGSAAALHKRRGQLQIVGARPDIVLIKFHLQRYGYGIA